MTRMNPKKVEDNMYSYVRIIDHRIFVGVGTTQHNSIKMKKNRYYVPISYHIDIKYIKI